MPVKVGSTAMSFIAATPRRRWLNRSENLAVDAECSHVRRPSLRSPVSSKFTTGEAMSCAVTWLMLVEIGCGAGGRGGNGAGGHGGAEQFGQGDRGAFLGQELAHEQVHDDGQGFRTVLGGGQYPGGRVTFADPPAGAPPGDDLVFHDADRDRWDVEHLPAGAADLLGVGQVRPAAAATGGFVPDDLVRVGDLIQGGAFVAGLPSGLAVGRATQGPRRRLAQSVAGRRFRGGNWSGISSR